MNYPDINYLQVTPQTRGIKGGRENDIGVQKPGSSVGSWNPSEGAVKGPADEPPQKWPPAGDWNSGGETH